MRLRNHCICLFCFICLTTYSIALSYGQNNEALASELFSLYSSSCKVNHELWSLNLHSPILLLDSVNDIAYTNFPLLAFQQKQEKKVFVHKLKSYPDFNGPIIQWKDRTWIAVYLPWKAGIKEKLAFLAHESFHIKQVKLGIKGSFLSYPYLSTSRGKHLMNLELQELVKALDTSDIVERKNHIKKALSIRGYRYKEFPQSEELEKQAELNEGLAEYTGLMYAGYSQDELVKYYGTAIKILAEGNTEAGYPYLSGSLYAFLNDRSMQKWKNFIPENSISDICANLYSVDSLEIVHSLKNDFLSTAYALPKDSNNQEKELQIFLREYFSQRQLILSLSGSSVNFGSSLVFSLENLGTVYNSIIITSNWGKLEVGEKGKVLISQKESKIVLNADSLTLKENLIKGENWQLLLKEQFEIVEKKGSFYVQRTSGSQ